MNKHVVIIGAGFAGLELAARLSESVADEVRVTLIDRNDSFHFGFSKLDVLLGRRTPAEVLLHYRDISKEGVEFRQETVTGIDPHRRLVTTDQGFYDADFLVVALGAEYDMAATPGFAEGGFEYYTLAGAERLRSALADFASGTILIGVLGHPFKCPPAPFEGAFLVQDLFVKRGLRHAVQIRMTFPMAAPVPVTKQVSQMFMAALDERGIEYAPKELVVGLDARERTARLASGGSVPYDLFIGIPVHRAPEVLVRSGLAPDGWVPVDQNNLTRPAFPAFTPWATSSPGPGRCPKPACSPRTPHGSSPMTSPHVYVGASLRRRGRVSATATSSSAKESSERLKPTSWPDQRPPLTSSPLPRTRRREEYLRRDPAPTLVRGLDRRRTRRGFPLTGARPRSGAAHRAGPPVVARRVFR
jgi:sulfide:quinone oxidoreductase